MPNSFTKALILTFFTISLAHAGDHPLTLRETLARTLKRSPQLATFAYEERVAEARILQAGIKPNPEVAINFENFAGSQGHGPIAETEATLEFSQLLELGGKRSARIREAQAGKALVHYDYEAKRLEVLSEAAQTFYEVLGAQRQVTLNEEIVKLVEEFAPAIKQRMEVGKASAVEATQNEVAIASARIGLEQAKYDLSALRRKLASHWGAKQPEFVEAVGDLEHVSAPDNFTKYLARLSTNPLLIRWGAETERRRATVLKEQAEAKPDLTVKGGPRWLNGPDETALVAGVSIPLPLRLKNEGTIREAQVMVEKASAEKRVTEAALTAEAGTAYEQMAKAYAEIQILTESVLPSAQNAVEFVRNGYAVGKLTQLDVLEARRTIASSRTQYLQALVAFHKAAAQLDALTGNTPHSPKP